MAEEFSIFGDDEESSAVSSVSPNIIRYSAAPSKHPPSFFVDKVSPFVGLDNQGATCYLNSLLQTMFMTFEFRSRLFELSNEELEYDRYLEEEKERKANEIAQMTGKGGASAPNPPEPSQDSIDELTAMGLDVKNVIKALKLFPAREQQEQCLDYLFNHDFSQDNDAAEGVEEQSQSTAVQSKPKIKRIPIELRRLFAILQASQLASVPTQGLTRSFGWNTGDGQVSVQHDIQELSRIFMDALHRSLENTSQAQAVPSLYQGTLVTKIMCYECNTINNREEPFLDLTVSVGGFPNLIWSLNEYVAPEILNGSNQYRCSVCNKKCDAKKGVALRSLPPILTFSLNRFVFDYSNFQRKKLHDRFSFPIFLDMQPFLEANLDFKSQRSKEQVVEDLKASGLLEPSLPSSTTELNVDASNDSSDHVIIDDVFDDSRTIVIDDVFTDERENVDKHSRVPQSRKRRKRKDEEQKNEPQLPLDWGSRGSDSPHLYQLFAVVVHAGTAHGGHYHALIRNLQEDAKVDGAAQSGQEGWYDFNDSTVRPVSVESITEQYGGKSSECAYMLIYRLCSRPPLPIPSLPEPEKSEIETANSTLKHDREQHLRASNEIKIVVRTERSFVMENSRLKDLDPKDCFEILFDQRLKQNVLASTIQDVLSRGGQCPEHNYKLHLLQFWNDGAPFNVEIDGPVSLDKDAPVQGAPNFYSGFVTHLIAWDGENINGVKYVAQDRQVDPNKMTKLVCRYHNWQTPDFPTEFEVEIPTSATCLELCQLLEQRTSLEVMDQHLHLLGDGFCCDVSQSMLGDSLEDCGFITAGTFALEKRTGDSASSLARARYESTKTALTLTVLVGWESAPRNRLSIKADRTASLAALKNAIIAQLPFPTTSESGFRLRRVIGENKLAALYLVEDTTLASLGFDETTIVKIEKGSLPTSDQLDLLVTVVSAAKVLDRPERVWQHYRLPVIGEKSSTLREFAALVLNEAKLNQQGTSEFHLYRTTADDSRGKPFDEAMTLSACKISNGDVLWLEEGPIQAEGEIKLDVMVNFASARESIASWVAKQFGVETKNGEHASQKCNGCSGANGDLQESLCKGRQISTVEDAKLPESVTVSESVPTSESATTSKSATSESVTSEIVAASESVTSGVTRPENVKGSESVKGTEIKAPESVKLPDSVAKPELNYLLTLQLSNQSTLAALKTRLLETSDVLREHASSSAFLRIRFTTRNNGLGKLISCEEATLKSQGLNSNKQIAVQVLREPDVGLSKHAMLLSVYRVVPNRANPKQLLLGPLPPEQIVFDAGANPTATDLLNRMSLAVDIPIERLVCAKWFGQARGWGRSSLASTQTATSDDSTNLVRKPFLLKDNDVFCVADIADFPDAATPDVCVSSWPHPVVPKNNDDYNPAYLAPARRREEPTLRIKF